MTTPRSRRSLLADLLVAALVAGGFVVIALGDAVARQHASERDTAHAVVVRMAAGS
jgi:hypothetical protein